MAYPTAQGYPAYSGTFIPEIWSGQLIKKFYETTILSLISNTKYEGEISGHGDKVIIRTVPTMVIRDYVVGNPLTYERPTTSLVELLIDKGKYFGFEVNDVMAYQSDLGLLELFSNAASEQMKIEIDRMVLGSIAPDAHPKNRGATAGRISGNINLGAIAGAGVAITKDNILRYIIKAASCLDEQNIPATDRFLVAPVWFAALLKESRLIEADVMGDDKSVLRSGVIGNIDRFKIILSNLLPTIVDTGAKVCDTIFFGTPEALCFATQMTKMDTLRSQSSFDDLVRGLQVYGFKVVQPECLGYIFGYESTS